MQSRKIVSINLMSMIYISCNYLKFFSNFIYYLKGLVSNLYTILIRIKNWTLNIKMNRCIHCLIASNKHKLCPKIEAIDFYTLSTVR